MSIEITAIGTANPSYCYPQSDVADFMCKALELNAEDARRLKAIYRKTGIQKRHSVIKDYQLEFSSTKDRMKIFKENALSIALKAIENCLLHFKNFNIQEITHIITVSCTGMYAPGLDIEILHALKLNESTKRLAIHFMGCYAVFNALKVAHDICRSEINAKVLIVSVELCSLHIQKSSNLDDLVAGAIFSDGAAACIVQNAEKAQDNKSKNIITNNTSLVLDHFYCDLIPEGQNEMAWGISDQGFDIVLSSYVSNLVESGIEKFLEKAKKSNKNEDINLYAIHPGGLKILKACEKALKISPQDNFHSYEVMQNFGNMSSATILFVLKSIWNTLKPADHHKNIFACAFGPGLTLESMFLKVVCV